MATDPADAGVGPFDAPAWKLSIGLARVPRIIRVDLRDASDSGYELPRSALQHLTDLPDLLTLEILGDWFDDRCCGHLEALDSLVDLIVEANGGLTAQGFALLLLPKLEGLIVSGADLRGVAGRKLTWPTSLRFVGLQNCLGIDRVACAELSQSLGESCELQTLDATYRGGSIVAPLTTPARNRADDGTEVVEPALRN